MGMRWKLPMYASNAPKLSPAQHRAPPFTHLGDADQEQQRRLLVVVGAEVAQDARQPAAVASTNKTARHVRCAHCDEDCAGCTPAVPSSHTHVCAASIALAADPRAKRAAMPTTPVCLSGRQPRATHRALLVPAPIKPRASTAFIATSVSAKTGGAGERWLRGYRGFQHSTAFTDTPVSAARN